ncbi:hypothetical protein PAXINDRAFT_9061 [Paxillus involutus ATCC 200175]|nr:hypothetical protein PAXINDRAFT_9061 [Paxillus involutus ATCC 200175]
MDRDDDLLKTRGENDSNQNFSVPSKPPGLERAHIVAPPKSPSPHVLQSLRHPKAVRPLRLALCHSLSERSQLEKSGEVADSQPPPVKKQRLSSGHERTERRINQSPSTISSSSPGSSPEEMPKGKNSSTTTPVMGQPFWDGGLRRQRCSIFAV